MNTSTVKSLFFILFICSPFFVIDGFSIIYTNCGDNLNGTIFCVDLQNTDRLPKLQAGTTCEISSEVEVTYSDDYSNMNACRTEGIFLRNWRVTDACGDTIYCTQRLNVQFNTILECINPSSALSCIDELTPETGKGLLFLTQSCLNRSAFTYNPTDDLSNLSELGEGFVIRTWELSHPCGYSRTCSQRINVRNNSDPNVSCEPNNLVQECNGLRNNEAAALSWNEANKKKLKLCSADNCSNVTITSDFDFTNLSDECGFTGEMIVTYTITDIVGNSTTKTATFTITDTTAPNGNFGETNIVINCTDVPSVKDFLIEQDVIHINELTSFSSENCGNLTVISDFNPSSISENCQSQRETAVTYTLVDECSNFKTFVWNYTIIDRAISDVLCEEIEITAINNELIIDKLFAPNSIVKVFDANWQPIFNCSSDCPETITIPDLNANELYHTDIQLYDANWQFVCEDKQDIAVMGIAPPCNTLICTRDVIFRTQEALDAFCGCEVIRGDLYIGAERNPFREIPESNIHSLASFRGLRKVEGSIIIVKTQLTDLKGLEELADVHALIISENGQLKSLDGLRKVNVINSTLSISKNPQLNNLGGLSNLSAVGSQLNITENLRLKGLSGLSNLKAAVSISISKNASLESLNGLENLDSLKNRDGYSGSLSITKNTILNDITALSNLQYIEGNFFISENPLLENCCPILHLIDENPTNGAATDIISIFRNGIGFCDNKEEVIEACQSSMPCDTSICQGDVFLKTQTEVDAFCGCAVIEGDLMIGATGDANDLSDISDLSNLANLQQVNGNLNISNSIITEIAFNNLTNVVGTLAFTNLPNFSDLNGLQNLESIGNQLVFKSNPSLLDASALTNLKELGGLVLANSALESIAFLNNLESSTLSTIDIMDCDNLTNLNGLEGVNTIERAVSVAIRITVNDNLLDISSLENLRRVAGNVLISFNPLLNDCCSLAHLIDGNEENGEIEGRTTIQDNADLCASPGAILQNCQISPCDTTSCQGNLVLNTQAEVDAFCGCEVIEGSLLIGGFPDTDIETLQTLQNLKSIKKGGLVITNTSLLKSLKSLSNLTNVDGVFIFGKNQMILDLDGLQALTRVGSRIVIEGNSLNSLNGLENLTEVGENVEIVNNSNLESLAEFKALTTVNDLLIGNNDKLVSLKGLDYMLTINGNLTIAQNNVLSDCCQITHLVDAETANGITKGGIEIANNAEFCNSIGELLVTCQATQPTCENIQIQTQNNQIVIEGLTTPNEIVKVFDKDFNIVYQCVANCEDTQMAGTFSAGNYTVDLQLYDENWALICAEQRAITLTNGNPCNSTDCETIAPVLGNIPADVTLECDDTPEISEAITVTDNCDNDVEVIFIEERIDGNCSSNYQLIRTWTATDDCGNTASARQVMIFGDFTAPVLTDLPPDLTFNANDGFDTTFPTSLDNCDSNPTLTVVDAINSTETEIVRTFTSTDNCGNFATAQQVITIIQNEASLCDALDITTMNGEIRFNNIDAPNSIVKVFDANYQIIFDCTATCENELVVPVEGEGIYHTDVQFYDENWGFLCKDRQDIEVTDFIENCYQRVCDGNIAFENQMDIDTFCGCEIITGTLRIGPTTFSNNKDIVSIEKLRGIRQVKRLLIQNTILRDLVPLSQLVVERDLTVRENAYLENLDGLINIQNVDGTINIADNPLLENIDALKVKEKLSNVVIRRNDRLQSIKGLSNLKVASNVYVGYNANLPSLDGLNNLDSVLGNQQYFLNLLGLRIYSNDNLTDIKAIKNVKYIGADLGLSFNPLLQDCCSLKNLVDNNPTNGFVLGNLIVNDNGSSCNSTEEIIQNCQSPTEPVCTNINIQTTNNRITISNLIAPIEITKVFDANYKIIYECFADCEETITVNDLVAGTYHLSINFYDENWQYLCEKIETVEIEATSQDRNIALLPADFALYPNPAEAETFIDLAKLKGETVQLTLFNQFGQKMSEQTVEKVIVQKERIDISTLQNGVYILQIKTAGKRPIAKKLMVTRLY